MNTIPDRVVISTSKAPQSSAPLSQAIRVGPFVFVSGQVGKDPGSGNLVSGGIAEQTRQTLANLRAVLYEAGTNLEGCVKLTCFLTDIGDTQQFNAIYHEFFPVDPPARSTVGVAALAPNVLVEVEAIAAIRD